MKKYNTSKLTIITALLLTASLFLSGCSESAVDMEGGGENGSETVTETTVTEAEETTPAVTVSEETTEPVTSAAETEVTTTAAETEQTTEAPATASVTLPAPAAWTETEASGTFYINTNGIYSRKEAVQGSAKVKQYRLNDKVTVVAKTDTDYYKLSDGSFIHTDYLSANKVTVTTTAVAIKPVVTVSYAQQSNPTEQEQQDRSYLNLSNSDVQYILNECQKYAVSLGYEVMDRSEYETECDELNKKCRQLRKEGVSEEEIDKIWDEFEGTLRYFTDCNEKDFWSGNWHNIIYAGDFTSNGSHDGNGYDLHCSTKQESIDWVIQYLKNWIKHEANNGRSCSTIGTKLKDYDAINKANDGWHLTYEDFKWEYSSYHIFDMNTSYAFSVKFY